MIAAAAQRPNRISTELARTETPDNLRLVAESPAHWVAISDLQLDAFQEVGSGMFGDITTTVGDARSETEQQALFYLLVTAAAVLVSAILALVVARRITKPLRNLTEAADRLSTEQLPALVERLKSPGSESERILLELKDKLGTNLQSAAGVHRAPPASADILNALYALGYNEKEAAAAVKTLPDGVGVADGIRQALKVLAKA